MPARSNVLIDVTKADYIDQDIIEMINEFARSAPERDVRVELKTDAQNGYRFSAGKVKVEHVTNGIAV